MSLNWREIDLILDELDLVGSHIQKIRQPDFKSLVFDLFSPGRPEKLIICLGQGETRLHRTTQPLQSGKKLQRFAQMLRSRIGGGRITKAHQIGGERIVRIQVERAGETTLLWIRLWGGAANIIATDSAHLILDAFYRRPKRGEVSGAVLGIDEEKLIEQHVDDDRFTIRDLPGEGDFNSRIEAFYDGSAKESALALLRSRAQKILDSEGDRLKTRIRNIERRLAGFDDAGQYKSYGDLIYANVYRINRGDSWLEAESFDEDGQTVRIELDPALSPQENAERYYSRYRKAKSGRGISEEDLHNARQRLAQVEESKAWADTESDIGAIERFLSEQKQTASKSRKEPNGPPGLRYSSSNYTMFVGRTARENDELLRKWVRGNDYWLHTRDYPGGYIFIKSLPGKSIPLDVLIDAGTLAVFYSKARNSGRAELYYTQVKHLRRAKDAKFGTVLPSHEKNLSVVVDETRLKRLLDGA